MFLTGLGSFQFVFFYRFLQTLFRTLIHEEIIPQKKSNALKRLIEFARKVVGSRRFMGSQVHFDAEYAEEDSLCVPLRVPQRPLRLRKLYITHHGRGGGPVRGFLLLKSAMKACVRSIAGTAVRIAGSSLLRSSVMVTPRWRAN